MAETIPNLWPVDIQARVLTPVAILRAQASEIRKLTQGVLDAEVSVSTNDKDRVWYVLDLIAPALSKYRYRVLSVGHQKDMVYPTHIQAKCYEPPDGSLIPVECRRNPASRESIILAEGYNPWRSAATDEEFMTYVGEVLRSKEVHAIINSLIARSNETSVPPAAETAVVS